MRKDIFYKEINDLGIRIHLVERKFTKKDPFVFFKFYNIAKRFQPSIVQPCGNMTAVYSLFAKMLLDFRLVNFQIRDAPLKPRSGLMSHKITFPFSDLIIANSNAGLKSYKAPQNKSKVIHNGFDFTRIQNIKNISKVRKKYGINTRYIVAMIARFSKHKDYITYIQAANIILCTRSDITFLCIGHGDYKKFKDFVNQQNIENVIFLSQQEEIENIMNICNIGILITHPKFHGEGIPNVLMEFMSIGKPVITTKGGGTKELVIDGETGYMIPPQMPEILSEKINYLLDNPDIAEELGINGQKRIKKEFNIDKMIKEFVYTYYEAVNA